MERDVERRRRARGAEHLPVEAIDDRGGVSAPASIAFNARTPAERRSGRQPSIVVVTPAAP